jgi:hypothetical protein
MLKQNTMDLIQDWNLRQILSFTLKNWNVRLLLAETFVFRYVPFKAECKATRFFLLDYLEKNTENLENVITLICRSQWPRGLRRSSTAARLLRSWVQIPPGEWMFVCCVLSGRGLCNELITRPRGAYRLWRVVLYDQETSWTRSP